MKGKWHLIVAIAGYICILANIVESFSTERRLALRDAAKEMFFHGYNNYLDHAFPQDELNPILCSGRGHDRSDPTNINVNDVLGDYSLTLVDSLDTLAILGEQAEFENAVKMVVKNVRFNVDSKVQVFEVNIRVLGGLLSAHILASDPSLGHAIPSYGGELLDLAYDLGKRLLPAFKKSPTGLPYPRVNLRHGVPRTETTETCTAGAGSLILEFGVLSRLTKDPSFELAAKRALYALWNRRSDLGLLGNVIDLQTGQWIHTASSTGAGIDSFYEYLLKAYILFGEDDYLEIFSEAYSSIIRYIRDGTGHVYRNVHMHNAVLMSTWVDSLSAFFPGLQVLYGDLDSAVKSHLLYYNIWRKYGALPERFDLHTQHINIASYPLRPELVESTYFLYQATKDPFYLEVGERILHDLNNRTRVKCGFATIGNVITGELEDRMESFVLSETFKYLYLLFDTDNPINKMDSNYVFTTEGHVLHLPRSYQNPKPPIVETFAARLRKLTRRIPSPLRECPAVNKSMFSTIPARPDAEFARETVGVTEDRHSHWHKLGGYCEIPNTMPPTIQLVFGQENESTKGSIIEDVRGLIASTLSGLRVELSRILKPKNGYEITRVENYWLAPGQVLRVGRKELKSFLSEQENEDDSIQELIKNTLTGRGERGIALISPVDSAEVFLAAEALYGPPVPLLQQSANEREKGIRGELIFLGPSSYGCDEYTAQQEARVRGKVVVIPRGSCTFARKTIFAQRAGALAVIFANMGDELFTPAGPAPDDADAVLVAQFGEITLPSVLVSGSAIVNLISLATEKEPFLVEIYRDAQQSMNFKERQRRSQQREIQLTVHGLPILNMEMID
ncbi:uncharacterized protein VTP21DRAFT_10040 [Calcarisporiella thermophila]|uniref:uncharacterized protein n=1 Tax=Calcarisporiella thermophila TaxID=911321 RepID=UPI0037449FA1